MENIQTTDVGSICFRPITEADQELLYHIYAGTREEEMAMVEGWTDEQRASFLRQQFGAQHQYYIDMYAGAEFDLILLNGEAAGRLYLHKRENEWRIVDIALLPDYRNSGLGELILQKILSGAQTENQPVTIHVERYNRALSLYNRLGFNIVSETHPVYYLMEWRAHNG